MKPRRPAHRPIDRLADRPILIANGHDSARELLAQLVGKRPSFVCVIAHTETAEIEGLSAAGATPELRRYTAAADAEALLVGRPLCIEGVPVNPLGAPGPVLITIAALRLAGIEPQIVDAGTRIAPAVPRRVLSHGWGGSIVTGRAVPHARELFDEGRRLGSELAKQADYLVVGESVPGGTTTALALLVGLGVDAWERVSSSMADNPHDLKSAIARQALAAASIDSSRAATFPRPGRSPLDVAAAVGDPMQPVVAGMLLEAHREAPVMLAGGSQMAAVLALCLAHCREHDLAFDHERVAIATTGWVLRDPMSDVPGLVAELGGFPLVAADLRFGRSRHPALRRYEEFMVKEGVGAGGASVAASLRSGLSAERILEEVEAVYDEVFGQAG